MKQIKAVCAILMTMFIGMMLFGADAHAYIDPSVVTYLIQAIAGVVIAIGAVVGLYWRKAKKKAQEKLGVSETKEMESDEISVNAEIFDEEKK